MEQQAQGKEESVLLTVSLLLENLFSVHLGSAGFPTAWEDGLLMLEFVGVLINTLQLADGCRQRTAFLSETILLGCPLGLGCCL